MSLDDLDQALHAARWGTAEAGVIDVIAKVLELPAGVVERVLFAATVVRAHDQYGYVNTPNGASKQWTDGPSLSAELRQAISLAVEEGLARTLVRESIAEEVSMLVAPAKLIQDVAEICTGCPYSIDCIAKDYSNPRSCYDEGPPSGVQRLGDGLYKLRRYTGGKAVVRPQKIDKDTVTVACEHPRGTFKVAAKDLSQ